MKTAKELALMAARALSDKKGREIQVLEIGGLTTLADYFVIATGSSNTQINALCGSVEKLLEEQAGEKPLRREGGGNGRKQQKRDVAQARFHGCMVRIGCKVRAFRAKMQY